MPSALFYAGSFVVAFISWYIFQKITAKNPLPLPPGPPTLPVIGNVHQAPKSFPWLQYHEWIKTYGPIVHLDFLGQSVILLGTQSSSHDLLSKQGAMFSDRPRFVVADMAINGMNTLFRPYDERFKLHQKLEAPILNQRASLNYLPLQDLETKQLLHNLLSNPNPSGVDCHAYFETTMASIIYTLSYGFRINTSTHPALAAAHDVNNELEQIAQVGRYLVDTFPSLNALPASIAPWKAEAGHHWKRQRDLHTGNLEKGYQANGWNFSKHMRKNLDRDSIDMSEEELALDIGTIGNAALETTAVTMMWFVVACLTSDRGFVARARRDIDAVVGKNRLPTYDDRPALPYIDAIVEEVMRWRPAGPAGMPHFTKTESTYKGYKIPANSIILPNFWSITREESVFGPNVDDFEPERWLPGDGMEANSVGLNGLPTIGFGYGRRVCPGQHIARNVLWITIARLLWAFDMEAGLDDKGEKIVVDPLACTDGLVTEPRPFKVVFKPRGSWVNDLVKTECDTSGEDFEKLLEQIGKDMAQK